MSLHADIVKILNSEGAASEGGWHSWRCFDKGRYPEPCECTEVVASMVMFAALDAALEAVVAVQKVPDAEVDYHRDYSVDPSGDTRSPRMWLRDALAAIDALRTNTSP